jgi:hypothetical protein
MEFSKLINYFGDKCVEAAPCPCLQIVWAE